MCNLKRQDTDEEHCKWLHGQHILCFEYLLPPHPLHNYKEKNAETVQGIAEKNNLRIWSWKIMEEINPVSE